jgi:hypothetical protein
VKVGGDFGLNLSTALGGNGEFQTGAREWHGHAKSMLLKKNRTKMPELS